MCRFLIAIHSNETDTFLTGQIKMISKIFETIDVVEVSKLRVPLTKGDFSIKVATDKYGAAKLLGPILIDMGRVGTLSRSSAQALPINPFLIKAAFKVNAKKNCGALFFFEKMQFGQVSTHSMRLMAWLTSFNERLLIFSRLMRIEEINRLTSVTS